eukprot:CAMPEP_0117431882 /NCGR_PEP_ID=MMETSP0758-20121206/11427_1 /TAXON_ID=63605 /ORGANISM="Percolomonas cosmopolitus, Strain AE-1 (ATCC 50343)" /LENGTH=308 /DNA_ID=CAMNT_0005221357 /DNA_START=267 /DNA_END=1190 /DNA_ORIENTATION=+
MQCGQSIGEGLFMKDINTYGGPEVVGPNIYKDVDENQEPLPNNLQLLSIRSTIVEEDMLLRAFRNCPTLDKDRSTFHRDSSYQSLINSKSKEIQSLNDHFGLKSSTTFSDYIGISDTLQVLRKHKLVEPSGDDAVNFDKAVQLGKDALVLEYNSSFVKSKGAGVLLHSITNRMEQFIAGELSTKFKLYVAHDTTLLSLFSALNIDLSAYEISQPEEVSALLIELVRDKDVYSVKFSYQPNWQRSESIPLKFTKNKFSCLDSGCSFSSWKSNANVFSLSPKLWCDACSNSSAPDCLKSRISDLMTIIIW